MYKVLKNHVVSTLLNSANWATGGNNEFPPTENPFVEYVSFSPATTWPACCHDSVKMCGDTSLHEVPPPDFVLANSECSHFWRHRSK
jgi:hypothetical protein